ncbi:hypothetical protein CEUSTIGMA_g5232.t1 [Chlamydomonas eustigma]|uniref:Condensin complex subunit 1 C-terminal domain-containing protein n=1 Tax=Chlamydomonas eustigma TaxID=1157962 RepID=A0A250X4E7_9CHLO|nr:hypothetical protein CEUSTIGMA_g5232.t1 [Chlamydomonas eustigma]|eukprot:GAX77789.1 hypothetical protein CEUSTIGMA_g5232.t1 [Chlamydomonas eustigma]
MAASLYTILLTLPGSPFSGFFDTLTFTAFLHVLRKAIADMSAAKYPPDSAQAKKKETSKSKGSKDGRHTSHVAGCTDKEEAGSSEGEPPEQQGLREKARSQMCPSHSGLDGLSFCVQSLMDLTAFLKVFGLKDHPDVMSSLVEICVDLTRCLDQPPLAPWTPESICVEGRKQGRSTKSAGASSITPADAAYKVLFLLLSKEHGEPGVTASAICQSLASTMMGQAQPLVTLLGQGAAMKRGTATLDASSRRTAAVHFVGDAIKKLSDEDCMVRPAMSLIRFICTRVPDKADCRAAASSSAAELMVALSHRCVISDQAMFLYHLSHSAKVQHRMMAVEVSQALLMAIASPFATDQALKTIGDGHGHALQVAPWSAVCLGILFHRSSDKAAVVRGRAMSHLVSCFHSFPQSLSAENDKERVEKNGFLLAMCGAPYHTAAIVTSGDYDKNGGQARRFHREGAEVEKWGQRTRKDVNSGRRKGSGFDEVDGRGDEASEKGGKDHWASPQAPTERQQCSAVVQPTGQTMLDLNPVMALASQRCQDDKGAVRKVALQLLEAVLLLRGGLSAPLGIVPDGQIVLPFEAAASDPLVSVRRAAMSACARLVQAFPHNPACCDLWTRCTLPMVRDVETSVQEEAVKQTQELLFSRAAASVGAEVGSEAAELLPLLVALQHLGRSTAGCLGRALAALMVKKSVDMAKVAKGLENILTGLANSSRTSPAAMGAWLLLEQVASQDPKAPSWKFLKVQWEAMRAAAAVGLSCTASVAQEGSRLLWVISHAAMRFPPEEASELAKDLVQALLEFNLAAPAVAAHVAALHKLHQVASSTGGSDTKQGVAQQQRRWCHQVLEAALDVLVQYMEAGSRQASQGEGSRDMDAWGWRASIALFTAGEVTLLKQAPVPGGLVVRVQAMTAQQQSKQLLEPVRHGDPFSAAAAELREGCDAALQGHAWVCLGKLCLADETLAKRCLPLFVQELSKSPIAVTRNNILVALADMVTHFTAIGDCHVPRLAACVLDPHPLVRTQALALLAHLLLKDFVKWKGGLFLSFLMALVDPSQQVRQLAEYLLGDTLASKAPALAYNHFIESIFVLNACKAFERAGKSLSANISLGTQCDGGIGSGLLNLAGSDVVMRAKRDHVYQTLLKRMAQEHKLHLQFNLVSEVLGKISEGSMPIDECEEVTGDILRLLASKEMRASQSKIVASEDDGAPGEGVGSGGGGGEALSLAKGKLLGALMKKHLVDAVVPIMLEMRSMMQACKHPLLGQLMVTLACLLRDHKAEIEDILAADRQLAREIVYDMKQAELIAKADSATKHQVLATITLPLAGSSASQVGGIMELGTLHIQTDNDRAAEVEVGKVEVMGIVPTHTKVKSNLPQTVSTDAPSSVSHGRKSMPPPPPPFGGMFSAKTPSADRRASLGSGFGKTPLTGLISHRPLSTSAAATPAPLSSTRMLYVLRRDKIDDAEGENIKNMNNGVDTIVNMKSPGIAEMKPLQVWNVNITANESQKMTVERSKEASRRIQKATHVVHRVAADAAVLLIDGIDAENMAPLPKADGSVVMAEDEAIAGRRRKGGRSSFAVTTTAAASGLAAGNGHRKRRGGA